MKILAVSDQVDAGLNVPAVKERFSDVSLIIGCGDLPYEYLEYLLTILNIPLVYVPGNHDPLYKREHPSTQAEGGICADGKLVCLQGLSIAGLGGSIRYRPGCPNQYSQLEMAARLGHILPRVVWNHLNHRRLDILVTHSPPFGIHDDDDPAHTGIVSLRAFLRTFRPRYHLHGHTMFYKQNLLDPVTDMWGTKIINVYPFRVIELEPA